MTAGDIFDGLMTNPENPFRLEVNPDIKLAMEEFVKETKRLETVSVGG